MILSVVGPEGSGKTTFAIAFLKRVAFGRPLFYIGKKATPPGFIRIELKDLAKLRNAVVLIDDANAFLESVDVYNKTLDLKEPFVLHREWNLVVLSVFHSFDDAVKYIFRQSRYIFVSCLYRDYEHLKNKFIRGITPVVTGRGKWLFNQFKRY